MGNRTWNSEGKIVSFLFASNPDPDIEKLGGNHFTVALNSYLLLLTFLELILQEFHWVVAYAISEEALQCCAHFWLLIIMINQAYDRVVIR